MFISISVDNSNKYVFTWLDLALQQCACITTLFYHHPCELNKPPLTANPTSLQVCRFPSPACLIGNTVKMGRSNGRQHRRRQCQQLAGPACSELCPCDRWMKSLGWLMCSLAWASVAAAMKEFTKSGLDVCSVSKTGVTPVWTLVPPQFVSIDDPTEHIKNESESLHFNSSWNMMECRSKTN